MRAYIYIGIIFFSALICAISCRERSPEGRLIIAAQNNDVNEIQKLLSQGVNVNCKDNSPDAATPLIWAVRGRKRDAIDVLLAAGADPNILCGAGDSSLFFAIGGPKDDTSDIIKKLIKAGADTDKYFSLYENYPQDDPSRIAYEQAIKLRGEGVKKQ
jgi:ankyrin repeat protein